MGRFLTLLFCLQATFLFAQEPDHQPTNLIFSNIKPYSFRASFSPSDAEKYLVIRSTSPSNFVPQDGVTYQLGQGVGNGKVFSVTGLSQINFKEVYAGTTYYLTIYGFNGTGANTSYKTDNPLTGSVTSLGKSYGDYYDDLSLSTPNFLQVLRNRLNFQKVWQEYSQYRNLLVPYAAERDTVNGKKVVTCQYSGEQKVYDPPFDFVAIGYSREHCMARSWMPTGGDTQFTPEGADYHNLLLTKNANVNGMRSNLALGEVVNMTNSYLDCSKGTDADGITVFEPREDVKGDVARAIFYQQVCYNGQGGYSWSFDSLKSLANTQNVELLYQWHAQDPPSPEEIARHEYVAFLQNNRNPFIDFPDLVNCINFRTLTLVAGCTSTLGTVSGLNAEAFVSVYPNPASDYLNVNFGLMEVEGLKLYNLQGVQLRAMSKGELVDKETVHVNIMDLPAGIYVLSLQSKDGIVSKKVSIQ